MKFKSTLFFLTLIISSFFSSANAQLSQIDNIVGSKLLLKSEILNEEREIQVYLPDSYETSNKNYPVLYLLDGQRLFLHGVSLLQSFTHFKVTPEFIVVGITNKYPDRFRHFYAVDTFLNFIEKEVVQLIDNTFRTSKERLLFGWEYGGAFVIKSMLKKPDLFNAYIASSPFPLDSSFPAARTVQEIDSLLSSKKTFNNLLYFSASTSEGGGVFSGVQKLDSVLKNKAPKSMKWFFRKLDHGTEHSYTPYAAIESGIRHYYKYYPELHIPTFKGFIENGGVPYIKSYYKERAKQFGFPSGLSEWTKFSILRAALRANKYAEFDAYAKQFISFELINTIRNNQPYELTRFYIKNKGYEKAINIYKMLVNKHQKSPRPLTKIGDAYMLLNNKKEAKKYYKKAKKLSKD